MLKKLRTVVYHVADLSAAKEWYSQLTGVQPYFDEPFYVGFDINGCELGLDPDFTGVTAGNQSTVYWAVDDVAAAVKRVTDLGGTIIQDKTNVGGDTFVASLADPFGNNIGVIEGA